MFYIEKGSLYTNNFGKLHKITKLFDISAILWAIKQELILTIETDIGFQSPTSGGV